MSPVGQQRAGSVSIPGRVVLYLLHGVMLALYLPLGLVFRPVHWTIAFAIAAVLAAGGSFVAARRVLASTAFLASNAGWWLLAQAVFPVAP